MDEQQEHEAIGKCRYTMASNGTYTAVAYNPTEYNERKRFQM